MKWISENRQKVASLWQEKPGLSRKKCTYETKNRKSTAAKLESGKISFHVPTTVYKIHWTSWTSFDFLPSKYEGQLALQCN